jgi:peptide/nickel transport system permease protein
MDETPLALISSTPTTAGADSDGVGAAVGPATSDDAAAEEVARGARSDLWRRLRRNRPACIAGTLIAILLVLAIAGAPLAAGITGHPPNQQYTRALDARGVPIGPGQRTYEADSTTPDPHGDLFVLGADRLGRDEFVRVLYGLRVSLAISVCATLLALLVGTTLGILAGFHRGWLDAVISRLIETSIAFPSLLLGIGLAVALGAGLINVIVVIAVFGWYYPARIIRTVTITVRSLPYMEAATSLGATVPRLLRHHVLPQLTAPILIYGTSMIASNILFESGLSYLGLGVPPPTATWGQMLSDAVNSNFYRLDPWLAVVPGVALVCVVLAFNVLGDGLRDALDPHGEHL